MSDEIEVLKEAEKEQLSVTEADLPTAKGDNLPADQNHWGAGIILIAIGTAFLLTTVFGFALQNWWALFILIPGVSKLAQAGQQYQRDGRFSSCARGNFTWGLILILVACTFFFSWSWSMIWPAFLIIFGVGALLSGLLES